MSVDRRKFLKIASMSTILSLGGVSAFTGLRNSVEATQVSKSPEALLAKRWGMVVDMSKFTSEDDYQKCIDACHRIHNVPHVTDNPKHEIKWIWTETYDHAFPGNEDELRGEKIKEMPFLVLCNHCDNPPCVRVCPTKATFKRESDGIVMMDMHRCIGCRFCMAGCPYGARSFNYKNPRPYMDEAQENPEFPTRMKGVVEKCTLCYERLAKGLEPACVEAAKEIAAKKGTTPGLIFGDLEDPNSEVRKILSERFTIRRKPELGTGPSVYYII
jgi:molybdopterin-containing oxidoreductase family iron-sulfur binding subunit